MPSSGDIRGGSVSSMPLTRVRGIIVGPCTSTFLRHKNEILLAVLQLGHDRESIDIAMQDPRRFYAWECVSLVTEKRTLDFVVRRRRDLLSLIQGLNHLLFELNSQAREVERAKAFKVPLSVYKRSLVKMKISFEAFLVDMDYKKFILHQFWRASYKSHEEKTFTGLLKSLKTQEEVRI